MAYQESRMKVCLDVEAIERVGNDMKCFTVSHSVAFGMDTTLKAFYQAFTCLIPCFDVLKA